MCLLCCPLQLEACQTPKKDITRPTHVCEEDIKSHLRKTASEDVNQTKAESNAVINKVINTGSPDRKKINRRNQRRLREEFVPRRFGYVGSPYGTNIIGHNRKQVRVITQINDQNFKLLKKIPEVG